MDSKLASLILSKGIDFPGSSGKIDFHHAVVTKAMARGLPNEFRPLIDSPYNFITIDHEAHINGTPPSGIKAVPIVCRKWGYEAVRTWYGNIPFKVRPFVFPTRDEVENG